MSRKENVLLNSKYYSGLIIIEGTRKDIVIAAPHHAIGGITELPCIEHKMSDENTGFIAKSIAEELKASYLIGCNADIDYNKLEESKYCITLIDWNPRWLIEIHGHGSKKVSDKTIEISTGSRDDKENSIKFSNVLKEKINEYSELEDYSVIGDFDTINFKASKTVSINNKSWNGIHIELPRSLRIDPRNELPNQSKYLIECIINTIKNVCN